MVQSKIWQGSKKQHSDHKTCWAKVQTRYALSNRQIYNMSSHIASTDLKCCSPHMNVEAADMNKCKRKKNNTTSLTSNTPSGASILTVHCPGSSTKGMMTLPPSTVTS